MISIIVSVHNQLAMNKLFYESLVKTTDGRYELIIIDNNSTDGSREFFHQHADKVIPNDHNYSYAYCQNQGIKAANYDYLAFFNNDMLLSKSWDTRVMELLRARNFSVTSIATEPTEDPRALKHFQRKWKWIKYPMMALFGRTYTNLGAMARMMYGDFDEYAEKRYRKFKNSTIEGFSGCSIFMNRSVLDKVGLWDERIYAADYDLFFRLKKRNLEKGDIEPLSIAPGIFFHHYSRLTFKTKYEPFADAANLIALDEKWKGQRSNLLRDYGRML